MTYVWKLRPIILMVLLYSLTNCTYKQPLRTDNDVHWPREVSLNVANYPPVSQMLFKPSQFSDLQNYITEVMENNADLKAIAATVKALNYDVRIVRASKHPQSQFTFTHTRAKSPLDQKTANTASTGIEVSWLLDIWGRLADETSSALLLAEKSQHDYTHAKRMLVLEAAQSWVAYWSFQRIENQLAQVITLNHHLRDHYRERYQNGMAPYEFLVDARKQLQQMQTRHSETKLDRKKIRHYLNSLRTHPASDVLQMNNSDIPKHLIQFNGEISAQLLAERPDIQSAYSEVRAFDFLARAAHKAVLPQINLNGSAFKNGSSPGQAFGNNLLWQFVGGLSQPLFNSGQLKAIAQQKSAEAETAWWQYQNVVFTAIREVEDAIAADQQYAYQLKRQNTLLSELEQQAESNKERFVNGQLTPSTLYLSQIELIEQGIELAQTEHLYVTNRLTLVAALGLPIETLWENRHE